MVSAASISPELPAGRRWDVIIGVAAGLLTVSVWSGGIVITRYAVTTSLGPMDVAFLRYGVSGLCLLPILIVKGLPIRQIGLGRFAVILIGAGAPYLLTYTSGLIFAPSSHAGAITVGAVPLIVALFSAWFYRRKFGPTELISDVALVIGTLLIGTSGILSGLGSNVWLGDLLLLCSSILWTAYSLAVERIKLTALHTAAIVNVCSFVVIAPLYLLVANHRLLSAPSGDVAFQAVFQGLFSAIIGFCGYTVTVRRLGASRAAVIGALTPIGATALGIPLLGDIPTPLTLFGIGIVTTGAILAGGVFKTRP